MKRLRLICFLCLMAVPVHAGTELSLWHTYTPPSGEKHSAFILSYYKRGLFLGSCGPSTRSLQWSFSIDMQGEGPRFSYERVLLTDDRTLSSTNVVPTVGDIFVDQKKKSLRINLQVSTNGVPVSFVGNGEYDLREKR